MSYQPNHRTAVAIHRPPADAGTLDALLLDDDFDVCLDSEIATIRTSLDDASDF